MTPHTLFVLTGPTAVGKTAVALELAERLGAPIISADSRQMFRDIPIGTAAPTLEEQRRVKHYFVGTLPLDAQYSAARYETEALALLEQLFASHRHLVLSGGSMLYIDAVCKGIDRMPDIDAEVRKRLKERLETDGLQTLVEELRVRDPEYAARCDLKNHVRVVHALEVCLTTGRTFTSFRQREQEGGGNGAQRERPFRIVKIGLNRERAELFDRINRRVDMMVAQGFVEEARRVIPYRHLNSLNTVGYKEMFRHLDGEWDLPFTLDRIRKNTRVYAKKQLTWFLRDDTIRWFHPTAQFDDILRYAGV